MDVRGLMGGCLLGLCSVTLMGAGLAERYEAQHRTVSALRAALQQASTPEAAGLPLRDIEQALQRAEAHAEQGAFPQALERLEQAYSLLSGSLKQVKEPQSPQSPETGAATSHLSLDSLRHAYRQKADAAQSLLEAYILILQERGEALAQAALLRQALAQAQARAEAGEWPQAVKQMDGAYGRVQEAIAEVREGETLVRSLDFATPEEEYAYEERRFRTHVLLVKFVLKQQEINKPETAVTKALARANRLRRRARQQAQAGAYPQAIQTQESASQALVIALRRLGIMIPGL